MGKAKPNVPKAKAKSSSKAAPAAEEGAEAQPTPEQLEAKRLWQQRRDATKWTKDKLELARGQLQAAQKKGGCDWLQVAHEFHEIRLIRLAKRFEEKTLDEVPQELREGIEAYLAQCATGPDVERETFNEHRGAWDVLEQSATGHKREPETPEAASAIEKLKEWSVSQEKDVEGLTALMAAQAASAGAQEAGLTRIGWLFSQAQKGAELPGMTCASLLPTIEAGMRGHMADPAVQRVGFAALRGVAMAPGQLPPLRDARGIELGVEALQAHFKDKEVAQAANGAFWAMAQAAGKNSPELHSMRSAGVVEVLLKVMTHHAWDQTLCGRVRVTLPFIQED